MVAEVWMTHLEAVRPGAILVQPTMPLARSAILQDLLAPGRPSAEALHARRCGIGRAPRRPAIARAAAGVPRHPNGQRAIRSAVVDRRVDPAEARSCQPIARSAMRLAAAVSLG
jgi:hypothetical protein